MILHVLILLAVGKLLMMFLRKFPPASTISQKIRFPLACDLCLGFWMYLFLVLTFFRDIDVLVLLGRSYIPVFNELVSAASFSALMAYLSAGWMQLHGVIEIQ